MRFPSAAFSYDGGQIREVYRSIGTALGTKLQNSHAVGSADITLLGVNFDLFDGSVAARIGGV